MPQRAWSRVIPGSERRIRFGLLVALVLAGAATYRMLTFGPPRLDGFDEGIYAHYCEVLGREGVPGLRKVAARWADDNVLRMGPLPFRIGFIGVGAAVCRCIGEYSPFGLAVVSLAGGILLVLAGLLLARRWLSGRAGVIVAGLLFAASPLATGISRRGLQDSCFAALAVLALWAMDRFLERRRSIDAWLLGGILLLGFLTKESMAFVYPMLLALFLVRRGFKPRIGLGHLGGALVAAPVAAALVFAALAGSVSALLSTYSTYSEMQHTIPYALAYQRGPWFRYGVDFLLVGPVVVALAVGGGTQFGDRALELRRLPVAVLITGLVVFSCLPLRNLRLVLFLDTPLRILAAAAIVGITARVGRTDGQRRIAMVAATAAVLLVDFLMFVRIFVAGGVYDPVTANLMRALEFMP